MLCKEGPASRILSDLFCSITASDVPLYPFSILRRPRRACDLMVVYLTRPGLTCCRPAGGEHVPCSTYLLRTGDLLCYLPTCRHD